MFKSLIRLPSIRLQYLSNLCLTAKQAKTDWKTVVTPVDGADLVLLGNIGQPFCPVTRDFLLWTQDHFPRTFWVPGQQELSSKVKKSWRRKLDDLYKFASESHFRSLHIGVKYSYTYTYPNVTLALTPSWSQAMPYVKYPMYDWHPKNNNLYFGDGSPEARKRILDLHEDELEWLSWNIQKSRKTVCATSTILRVSPEIKSPVSLAQTVYDNNSVIALLHGLHEQERPVTYSGKTGRFPWSGVNMAGHSGFRTDAFFEYSGNPTLYLKPSSTSEPLITMRLAL